MPITAVVGAGIASEAVARWSLVDTGSRGLGLPHDVLIDRIEGKEDGKPDADPLLERVRRQSELDYTRALELIQTLESAGILQGGRRWRFAHDSYEEYFAASHLASWVGRHGEMPDLSAWKQQSAKQEEFIPVIQFLACMLETPLAESVLSTLPNSWRMHVSQRASHPARSSNAPNSQPAKGDPHLLEAVASGVTTSGGIDIGG